MECTTFFQSDGEQEAAMLDGATRGSPTVRKKVVVVILLGLSVALLAISLNMHYLQGGQTADLSSAEQLGEQILGVCQYEESDHRYGRADSIKELVLMQDATTHDNFRGETPVKGFSWDNRWNVPHTLKLEKGRSCTILYPASHSIHFNGPNIDGGRFRNRDSLRVGGPAHARWASTYFHNDGRRIRVVTKFYDVTGTLKSCTDWSCWKATLQAVNELAGVAEKVGNALKPVAEIASVVAGRR